jgi:hypothetical protein
MIASINEKALNPTDVLDFLIGLRGPDLSKDAAITGLPDHAAVHRAVRASRPFYKWIDGIIGRQ